MPKSPSMPDSRMTCVPAAFLGPALRRSRWMLRWDHISRFVIATALLAARGAAPAHAAPNPSLDAEQLHAAFTVVREWVSDFQTPKMDDSASRVPLTGASGVCVILRRAGRVMGVGVDAAGDDMMLRRAVGKAMNEVLADPALSSLSARLRKQQSEDPNAAAALDLIHADLGRSLAIELEVAGKLTPLVGRNLEQLSRRIEPGLDGVGLRHQQSLELAFPAHMRALNTGGEPAKLLLSIALKTGVSLKEVDSLPGRDDFSLYSFRTQTLWQPTADQPPVTTVRGDLLVRQDAVTRQSITRFADDLAQHLMNSMWPDPPLLPRQADAIGPEPPPPTPAREPLGLMGDYSPVPDHYRPLLAPPIDQALGAFALNRYAMTHPGGSESAVAGRALIAATTIVRDLANVTPAEDDPRDDPAACAAIVFAVCAQPGLRNDASIEQLFTDAVKRIHDSFDPASGFVNRPADGISQGISPHAQAMIAGAMCRLLIAQSPPAMLDPSRVRAALDAAWQSVPDPQHIALLPWIGWAEADYAKAMRLPIARKDELQLMFDALNRVRIKPIDDPADVAQAQLAGGFGLISQAAGLGVGTAQATSQSARPAAWLAGVSRDSELIRGAEIDAAWQGHLATMRFLMQLSIRPELTGLYRNPQRSAGGIRAALWDSDQPVPAQAMALMAAAETLRFLGEQP